MRGETTSFPKPARVRRGGFFSRARSSEGSQLVEFAMVLPLLCLILLGILDFGGAFTLQHRLSNSSREGVRFAISEATADLSQWPAVPPTTQAILNDTLTYLTNTGVNDCGLTSSSGASATPSYADWVFSSACSDTGGNISIEINRGITFLDSRGVTVQGVKVTISRPYKWSLLISPFVTGAVGRVSTISSYSMMEQ
jgi:Flp pilus assembly protein TadG